VKFHLGNGYRKLGVRNRAAAIRWALEHGLDQD
jgi:DNA-binding CsgD family transcriptional regulator